jgi:hypothetical protein
MRDCRQLSETPVIGGAAIPEGPARKNIILLASSLDRAHPCLITAS